MSENTSRQHRIFKTRKSYFAKIIIKKKNLFREVFCIVTFLIQFVIQLRIRVKRITCTWLASYLAYWLIYAQCGRHWQSEWWVNAISRQAGVFVILLLSLRQTEFMYILQSLHPIIRNKLATLSMTAPGWRRKYAEANLPNTPFQNQIYLVRNALKDTLVSYHVTLWLEYRQAEI